MTLRKGVGRGLLAAAGASSGSNVRPVLNSSY